MSRTKRKPYTKSKDIDRTCSCHGSCPWCQGNRLAKLNAKIKVLKAEVEEWRTRYELLQQEVEVEWL